MSTREEIRIDVTRNKGDYFAAVWANYLHSGGLLWLVGGALVFFVLITAMAASNDSPRPWLEGALSATVYVIVVMPLNFLIMWMTASRSAKQAGAFDPITYTFTQDALEVQSSMGSGVTKWAAWRRAFETSRVLVIRQHQNLMQFLPTRNIPAETLVQLRRLLRGALAGRVVFKQEQPN